MKKLILAAAIFLSLFSASAQVDSFHADGSWHFDVNTEFGMRYGQINERNWYKSSKGTTELLSLLEWETKPVFYGGADFCFGYKGWNFFFGAKRFFNGQCGFITDSDWQNDFLTRNGDISTKTNLSKSDNFLTEGFELETYSSVKFYPGQKFSLEPGLGLSWSYNRFEARGGEKWYGNNVSGENYYYSWDAGNGKVNHGKLDNDKILLEYTNSMLYLWTGLKASFLPVNFFTVSLSFDIAPFTFFYALDHHPLRTELERNYFINIAFGAFSAYRSELSAKFKFNNNITVGLKFSGLITLQLHGDEYNGKDETGTFYKVSKADVGGDVVWFETGLSIGYCW